MPHISVTLPESEQAIGRPVIFGIIDQIQDVCKIDKSAKIYFPGPTGKMQTSGSDIDGQEQDRFATFENRRIVFIDVDEDFDRNTLGSTSVTREEYAPVFEDAALGVQVCPVYATSQVSIQVRYRTPSETEAQRWRDDMRMRITQMRDTNLHKVKYHYSLPQTVCQVIEEIYDKREAVAGYGEDLGVYFKGHATERLTLITDQVGKNVQFVVAENQGRIIGQFELDAIPQKPTRDATHGVWEVSFTYKFNYERPMGVTMHYPVQVHNQLLSPMFVAFTDKPIDPSSYPKSFSKSLSALNAFEMDTMMNAAGNPDPFIRMPRYDDFKIPQVPQGTGTAWLALIEVGEDKKELFNLNEMGNIVMDADVMKFIREVEWQYITKQFKSILHLTLYRNNNQLSTGHLECDAQLNVTSRDELDLRNQHRVRMGIYVDLTLLPKEAMERLCQYPKAFVKIMRAMNYLLRIHPDFGSLGDKNRITPLEFSDVYAVLTGYGYNNGVRGRNPAMFNGRPDQYPLFKSIDPRVRQSYQETMIRLKTLMSSYVVAYQGN